MREVSFAHGGGDPTVDELERAEDQCAARLGRYVCTRPGGHEQPHVAGAVVQVAAAWVEPEDGPVAECPECGQDVPVTLAPGVPGPSGDGRAVPDTEAVREALVELDDATACVCDLAPPAVGHWASCNADLRDAVEVVRAAVARDVPAPSGEWAVRHPDGTIEEAGILGEERARMLARRVGGEVITPARDVPAGGLCAAGDALADAVTEYVDWGADTDWHAMSDALAAYRAARDAAPADVPAGRDLTAQEVTK